MANTFTHEHTGAAHPCAAFRCRGCGHLHTSDHAGDRHSAAKCVACGKGTRFVADTILDELRQPGLTDEQRVAVLDRYEKAKAADPHKWVIIDDNWEVLADATPERLAELGLKAEHVERHVGKGAPPGAGPARSVVATAAETPHVSEKAQ